MGECIATNATDDDSCLWVTRLGKEVIAIFTVLEKWLWLGGTTKSRQRVVRKAYSGWRARLCCRLCPVAVHRIHISAVQCITLSLWTRGKRILP